MIWTELLFPECTTHESCKIKFPKQTKSKLNFWPLLVSHHLSSRPKTLSAMHWTTFTSSWISIVLPSVSPHACVVAP